MTYRNMKKRIAMLEKNTNTVDYPDDVMQKKPWTISYMNELYEWSVNGARSPRAIAHLKKVKNTIYASFVAMGVIVVAVIALVSIFSSHK